MIPMKCKQCGDVIQDIIRVIKKIRLCDKCQKKSRPEVEDFFNKNMEWFEKQIKNINEPPDSSLENTGDIDFQEEGPSTIERLRKYARESKSEKISKISILNNLKKKYPYFDSKFNQHRDRNERQYSKLVSTKNLKVSEFVLKWEGDMPSSVSAITPTIPTYTHEEILALMAREEWSTIEE